MFSQSATTNTFGQPSAFSTSATPFGTIGNTQPQQSSLFGQTSQTSLFGGMSQPGTTPLFGTPSQTQTNTAFGAQSAFGTTGGSLFGNTTQQQTTQQQPSTSLFGNTNRFGSTTQTGFGATNALGTALNVPTGTTIKFQPQNSTDTVMKNGQHQQSTSINIRLQCITCMREYESKSLEELRLEDYAAGRKGPQQNLFGSSTINTGTFNTGMTNTAFGQSSASSLFSNQKPFGSSIAPTTTTSTSLFNTNLTGNTGLFGNTNTNSTFGQTIDNKTSMGFFNQPSTSQSMNSFQFAQPNALSNSTTSNLFNNTGTSTAPSFFGSTQNSLTANKPMFGNTMTAFGQTQPQQQAAPIFGSTNTSGQTGTNIFGNTSQTPMFNTNNTNQLNKPAFSFTTPSLSGTSNAFNPSSTSTSNVFGSTGASNTGFGTNTGSFFSGSTLGSNTFGPTFGTNTSAPFPSTNSNFSFNLGANTGGFGNTGTNSFGSTGLTNTGTSGMFNMNNNQTQALTSSNGPAVNTEQIITRLQTMPYGTLPAVSLDSSLNNHSKTKFTTDPKTLNQYKLNAKSHQEIKVQRTPVIGKPTTLLFDGLDDESPDNLRTAADIFQPRQNIKKLILNKSSNTSSTGSPLIKNNISTGILKQSLNNATSPKTLDSFNKENESPLNQTSKTFQKNVQDNFTKKSSQNSGNVEEALNSLSGDTGNVPATKKDGNTLSSSSPISSPEKSFSIYGKLNFSTESNDSHDDTSIHPSNSSTTKNFVPPKCGVILTRADYYTIPSLEECDHFYNPDDDTCIVESFTVGRIDYGSIYWRGPLNIKGINLDEIVHIRRKEVIVYPDDDLKPPIGEGLNRPAQITLDQVWPIDKTTRDFIKDPERLRLMKYAERLEKATVKLDATFKEYRPDTGSWVFVVKHFSKYGLDAEDEETDVESIKGDQEKSKQQAIPQPPVTFMEQTYEMAKNNLSKSVHLNGTDIQMNFKPPTNEHYQFVDSLNEKTCFSNEISEPKYNFESMKSFNLDQSNNSIKSTTKHDFSDEEINAMRSALFVDDEMETVAKKCKNLYFQAQSQVSSQNQCPLIGGPSSFLFPSKLKASIPKKRRLIFKQNTPPEPARANVYSLHYSEFPKARFINGSNKFCLIVGQEVLIFQVDLLRLEHDQAIDKLEKHLESQSTVEISENESKPPLIKTNPHSLNPKIDSNLNSLIEALYGELNETGDYARHQERLRRILNWLFNFNKTLPVPEGSYCRILHFLTTNELEFAITECINSKMPRLSYLVSCGPYCSKELIVAQLDSWKRSEADQFIDKDLLKIYVALSGSSWTSSSGKLIQPLEDLHWTQQLTLLLLYRTRSGLDMVGTNLVRAAIEELIFLKEDYSVEYHLLAQNQPWVAITSSPSLLDSWFLQETLQSYNVIVEDVITNKCDSINLFMASQSRDLRWALFFVLHIKNDYLRGFFTKELLIRNSQKLDSDLETYFIEQFHLDPTFLCEAKLYLAKTHRNYREVAINLFAIGQYKEAHDILMDKIFPELIINEDYKEIIELIDKLRPHQDLIPNWNLNGAGIYDIFIQLLKFGQENKSIDHYRRLIENFNVHQMRCPTNRHVLCQSQMARVANIIHAEMNKGMFAYHTAVPHDYSLLELRSNAYKLYELKASEICSS